MVIMQFEMSKELNDNVKRLCIDKDIPNKRAAVIMVLEKYFKRYYKK